jgi:hypothetical protein
MEFPGRCGDRLDTDTVTVQGLELWLGTTSKGWGFYSATSGDLFLATCGDFLMATDTSGMSRSQQPVLRWTRCRLPTPQQTRVPRSHAPNG